MTTVHAQATTTIPTTPANVTVLIHMDRATSAQVADVLNRDGGCHVAVSGDTLSIWGVTGSGRETGFSANLTPAEMAEVLELIQYLEYLCQQDPSPLANWYSSPVDGDGNYAPTNIHEAHYRAIKELASLFAARSTAYWWEGPIGGGSFLAECCGEAVAVEAMSKAEDAAKGSPEFRRLVSVIRGYRGTRLFGAIRRAGFEHWLCPGMPLDVAIAAARG